MKIEKGTKVFISGAASGIGRATALALARRGARLFLNDLDGEGLAETCRSAEGLGAAGCRCGVFDISSFSAVQSFADEVHREFGPVEVLINNAGVALFALVEDMTHERWQKVINTNLWGPIHGVECFLPEMIRARRGHVVNVSSTAGLTGAPWHAAYSTAKWGLVGLSEVLRYDLRQHHIGVTVVCPGAVDTPIKYRVEIPAVNKETPAFQEMMRLFNRHAVTPERVAELIISAIEKERFLVITSWDIKTAYFLKRHFFPAYHLIMLRISNLMNSIKKSSPSRPPS